MNKFKERAYVPPVEKFKKTIGKYQEKLDKTFATRKITQAMNTVKTKAVFTQTSTKTKAGYGAYFLLFAIMFIFVLFVVFIIAVASKMTKTELHLI